MIDWRNGLLRLYFVLWGLWAVAMGMRTFARVMAGSIDMPWAAFLVGGFFLPGVLFFAYRWMLNGFFGRPASG